MSRPVPPPPPPKGAAPDPLAAVEAAARNRPPWVVWWAIVGPGYELLTPARQRVLLDETWAVQDGYGEPGTTPVQGWDWSGIRDSSPAARARIEQIVRGYLAAWGVAPPPEECEFCGELVVVSVLDDHPSFAALAKRGIVERYVACAMCIIPLACRSLAPWQFLRAKARGGDDRRHLLHDDFYHPETGAAFQPVVRSLTKTAPFYGGRAR